MEREEEIIRLLREIVGQLATMDVRLSAIEQDMADVKSKVKDIPKMAIILNRLHDKEIAQSRFATR